MDIQERNDHMTVMTILTADDLSNVKVEIKNVSVKYYNYHENIPEELYSRFKSDLPSKIIFGSENTYTKTFTKMLYDNGYELSENGDVLVINDDDICYATLEKEVENMLGQFTLEIIDEFDAETIQNLLLKSGYVISSKIIKGVTHIAIHNKLD